METDMENALRNKCHEQIILVITWMDLWSICVSINVALMVSYKFVVVVEDRKIEFDPTLVF